MVSLGLSVIVLKAIFVGGSKFKVFKWDHTGNSHQDLHFTTAVSLLSPLRITLPLGSPQLDDPSALCPAQQHLRGGLLPASPQLSPFLLLGRVVSDGLLLLPNSPVTYPPKASAYSLVKTVLCYPVWKFFFSPSYYHNHDLVCKTEQP